MALRAARPFLLLLLMGSSVTYADVALPGRGRRGTPITPGRHPPPVSAEDAPISVGPSGVVSGHAIAFDASGSTLATSSTSSLEKLARYLKAHAELTLHVFVHTDARGNDEWNLRLSQARADAIGAAFAQRSIGKQQVDAKGYGETQPFDPSPTPAAWAKNRRIELSVSGF